MEDRKISKFINKVKDKLSRSIATYPSINDYAFSAEELASISEQNRQKIEELKKDDFLKKEEKKLYLPDIISPIEGIIKSSEEKEEEVVLEQQEEVQEIEKDENSDYQDNILEEVEEFELKDVEEEIVEAFELKEVASEVLEIEEETSIEVEEDLVKEQPKNSFVYLNEENKRIVMSRWMDIDLRHIDKDIIDGKDLLNHNYTITYADDAAKFVHNIRKKYEVVICYLIGFNNEKKGVYDKTIFSDKMENEWRHLSSYIKILEKIMSFRK